MNAPFSIDRPDIVFDAVCAVLCDLFPNMRRDKLLAEGRPDAPTAWVRQVGMYVMTARLGLGQKETARRFGRDKATVLHASRKVSSHLLANVAAGALVDLIERLALERLGAIAASAIPTAADAAEAGGGDPRQITIFDAIADRSAR